MNGYIRPVCQQSLINLTSENISRRVLQQRYFVMKIAKRIEPYCFVRHFGKLLHHLLHLYLCEIASSGDDAEGVMMCVHIFFFSYEAIRKIVRFAAQ